MIIKEALKHNLNSMTQKLISNIDFCISLSNVNVLPEFSGKKIPQNPQFNNDQKVSLA